MEPQSASFRTLSSLSDDILLGVLSNLSLNECLYLERVNKRIKTLNDRLLWRQKMFSLSPRMKKSILMKKWPPNGVCSKSNLLLETLSWRGKILAPSILIRCRNLTLINLERIEIDGRQLAFNCPLITHLITDKLIKASDYVNQLILNERQVLIQSFEYQPLASEPEADFNFLTHAPNLKTLICPIKSYTIPSSVLSRIQTLSVFVDGAEKMDELINACAKNVTQLTIRCGSLENRTLIIASHFNQLIHLETFLKVEDFPLLEPLKSLRSLKALSASVNKSNISSFERYLATNGRHLEYLWIKELDSKILNQGIISLSTNCSNLKCFKIKNGASWKDMDANTIQCLPLTLEKINLDICSLDAPSTEGSFPDVEKLKLLLSRCRSSLRKISLSNNSSSLRFIFWGDLVSGPEIQTKERIQVENLNEMINILSEHARKDIGAGSECRGKGLKRIEMNGKLWDGKSNLEMFRGKMSFFY